MFLRVQNTEEHIVAVVVVVVVDDAAAAAGKPSSVGPACSAAVGSTERVDPSCQDDRGVLPSPADPTSLAASVAVTLQLAGCQSCPAAVQPSWAVRG